MNLHTHFDLLLRIAAFAQFALAILNFFLVRVMKWESNLNRLPLLLNEVFCVHCIFISISLSIFAVLTWRFAGEIAAHANAIAIWLATAIGIFWAIRAIMQWTYYSRVHWRGDGRRTIIHWILFLGYGAFAFLYLAAASGKFP